MRKLFFLLSFAFLWSGAAFSIGVPIGSTSVDEGELVVRDGDGGCSDGYEALGGHCYPKPPPCKYDCEKKCKIKVIFRKYGDAHSYNDAQNKCSQWAKKFGVYYYPSDCSYDYHKRKFMFWYPYKKYDGEDFVSAHIDIATDLFKKFNPKYHYETEYRYWHCGSRDHY